MLLPGLAQLVVQAGLVPGAGPAWFGPVFGISAIVFSAAAFIISWNQGSFLVAGLLAASGMLFAIPAMIATGFFAVIVIPGPILGVIIGLGIFGLGVSKAVGTVRMQATISR